MSLALFDLDHTLLAGDSDYLWGQFLVEQGVVDAQEYARANDRFYQQYQQGCLNINEFLRFALRPLAENQLDDLLAWRQQFIEQKIKPLILPAAQKLVEQHRQQGDELLIITATNAFITRPIADLFDIQHLIATEPEIKNGRYTGEVAGIPCFQQGKVKRLQAWLAQNGGDLSQAYFYSDSHNDLPLLKRVGHPVAVNPDEQLANYAQQQGWNILSW